MQPVFDSHVELYAVIGDPVDHSLSPTIHNTVLQHYGKNAILFPVHVPRGGIERFLDSIELYRMKGFCITMPHKSAIVPYLKTKDQTVAAFGAANAVKVIDGELHGHMFDGEGFAKALENKGVDISGKNVLILGAGDVTGSIALSMANRKANRITLLNRTQEKAERVAGIVRDATGAATAFGGFTQKELEKACEEHDLVIQATSLGMHRSARDYEDLSFLDRLPKGAFVSDVVYVPSETRFLAYARSRGFATCNGLGMLLRQAELIQNVIMDIPTSPEAYALAEQAAKEKLGI